MTKENFDKLVGDVINRCDVLLARKGQDYSRDDDVLYNLREIARRARVSALQAWQVMFTKQVLAIETYIVNGNLKGETIESRIYDAINYLYLLKAFVEDENPVTQYGDGVKLTVEEYNDFIEEPKEEAVSTFDKLFKRAGEILKGEAQSK